MIVEWGTTGLRFKGHYAMGVGFARVHVGGYAFPLDDPCFIHGSWKLLWGQRG